MSTYLPFGYRCQAAAAVSHQVNKQSPSESSDSGYKSETSNDDSRSCASEESQTSLACTSEYSKDSAIYPAHISHVSKVHEQNNPQQPSDLSYLQLQTHNVSGGIPLPQGSACSSSIAKVLPLDLRQNPRRSGQNRDSTQVAASQLPCTLRRGVVKRDCFVTRLVSTYKDALLERTCALIKDKLLPLNLLASSGPMRITRREMTRAWAARVFYPWTNLSQKYFVDLARAIQRFKLLCTI